MGNTYRNQRKTRAHREPVPTLVPEYKGIDLVLGHWNRARILARVLKKRCVRISAQRVLYSGTSTLKPSVNAHPKWGALKTRAAINKATGNSQPTAKFVFRSHIDISHKWHKLLLIFFVQLKPTKLNWSLEPTKAWFRRRTFQVLNLNLTELVRLWSDTGATSDSEGALCVELKLSSSKVRQTLSNLTLLPHLN